MGRSASLNGKSTVRSKPKSKVRNILDDDDDWVEDEGPRPEE